MASSWCARAVGDARASGNARGMLGALLEASDWSAGRLRGGLARVLGTVTNSPCCSSQHSARWSSSCWRWYSPSACGAVPAAGGAVSAPPLGVGHGVACFVRNPSEVVAALAWWWSPVGCGICTSSTSGRSTVAECSLSPACGTAMARSSRGRSWRCSTCCGASGAAVLVVAAVVVEFIAALAYGGQVAGVVARASGACKGFSIPVAGAGVAGPASSRICAKLVFSADSRDAGRLLRNGQGVQKLDGPHGGQWRGARAGRLLCQHQIAHLCMFAWRWCAGRLAIRCGACALRWPVTDGCGRAGGRWLGGLRNFAEGVGWLALVGWHAAGRRYSDGRLQRLRQTDGLNLRRTGVPDLSGSTGDIAGAALHFVPLRACLRQTCLVLVPLGVGLVDRCVADGKAVVEIVRNWGGGKSYPDTSIGLRFRRGAGWRYPYRVAVCFPYRVAWLRLAWRGHDGGERGLCLCLRCRHVDAQRAQ